MLPNPLKGQIKAKYVCGKRLKNIFLSFNKRVKEESANIPVYFKLEAAWKQEFTGERTLLNGRAQALLREGPTLGLLTSPFRGISGSNCKGRPHSLGATANQNRSEVLKLQSTSSIQVVCRAAYMSLHLIYFFLTRTHSPGLNYQTD